MDRFQRLLGKQRQRNRQLDTSQWAVAEQQLLDGCHPKQLAFVLDPSRRVAALVGRGGGKTTGGLVRFLRRMLRTPKARCVFVATTRQAAKELIWSRLKDLCEKTGVEARFNETELKCTLRRNGAQLRLVGADDAREIEKLRGLPHHEVGIDEGASHKAQLLEHLLFRIVGPRLGDYDGVMWMVGTPGHTLRGPFYEATRPGGEQNRRWDDPDHAAKQGWSLHTWTLLDGVAAGVRAAIGLWAEAQIEKRENCWSDEHPVWRREYLGEWAADDTERVFKYRPHVDGLPWNQWSPQLIHKNRVIEGFAELPEGDWSYVYGCDLGYSDSFALDVFAYRAYDRTLYHCCSIDRKRMYARTIAIVLLGEDWVERITAGKDKPKPGGLVGITGWPVGAVADKAALGQAVLDELAHVYGFKFEPAEKKDKHDAIELANGDLLDGRVKVLAGSLLERQLQDLQWDVDEFGRLREMRGAPNDHTDAFVYARRKAHNLFAREQPPPQLERHTPMARQQALDEDEDRLAKPNDDYSFLYDQDFTEWDNG